MALRMRCTHRIVPINSVTFTFLGKIHEIRVFSIASYPIKITGGWLILRVSKILKCINS